MNDDTRSHIEEFLKYADELGLGPFYRERNSSQFVTALEAQGAATVMAAGAAASATATVTGSGQSRQSSGQSSGHPTRGSVWPPQTPANSPEQRRANLPIVQVASGPSLFDERIADDSLERIRADIGDCKRCKLHKARTNIVFGVGNPKAELVLVGEGPGHDEDVQGEPFVGRAGKLLTQMIEAMGLERKDVYICNVVKCRPPENRLPERDEIETCSPFLMRQLAVIQPKVICCLGACSAQTLLQTNQGISRFRGEWFEHRGAKLIATYHPAYLLRNPNAKGEVWKDLQKVMAVLGLKPKPRK